MVTALSLSDCQVHKALSGDFCETVIITAATADAADTLDISTLVRDGQVLMVKGWDVDTGDEVTATYNVSTGVITIDAGGGDTNHAYAITVRYVGYNFTP